MLSFHPLFILFLVAAFLAGVGGIAIALILGVIVHELSHIAVAKYFGIRTERLRLLPFGAEIEIDATFLPTRERIIILLAGSFGNIVFALSIGLFLWIAPGWFHFWEVLIIANTVPAVLNLLPIYPFDGGKIMALLGGAKCEKVVHFVSIVFFALIFMLSVFLWHNFAGIVLAGTMVAMIVMEFKKTKFVSKFNSQRKQGRVVEVAIESSATLFEAYKNIDAKHYTKFLITDKGRILYENDIEKMLLSNDMNSSLESVLEGVDNHE